LSVTLKPEAPEEVKRAVQLYNPNASFRTFPPNPTAIEWDSVKDLLLGFSFQCGIKEPISEHEEDAMVNHLSRHFKSLNPLELSEAFSLYAAQKLDFKEPAYQAFTSLFVSKVLVSYMNYRSSQLSKREVYAEPNVMLSAPAKIAYFENTLFKQYQLVLEGKRVESVFDDFDSHLYYNSLDDIGFIDVSDEEKMEIWQFVTDDLRENFKPTRAKPKPLKTDAVKRAKALAFRSWVTNLVFDEIDLRLVLLDYCKEKKIR